MPELANAIFTVGADDFEAHVIFERHRLLRTEIVRHGLELLLGVRFISTACQYNRKSNHNTYHAKNRPISLRLV